jgi:CRP-like cAMP-binding protein
MSMQEAQSTTTVEQVDARDIWPQLRRIAVFSELREEDAGCLGKVRVVHAPVGSRFFQDGDLISGFWGLVEGEIRAFKREEDGSSGFLWQSAAGDSFGEVPLLMGRESTVAFPEVLADATLIWIEAAGFWQLMASCPAVRRAILANMQRRLESYQAFAVHRREADGARHAGGGPDARAEQSRAPPPGAPPRSCGRIWCSLQQISLRYCETPMRAGAGGVHEGAADAAP